MTRFRLAASFAAVAAVALALVLSAFVGCASTSSSGGVGGGAGGASGGGTGGSTGAAGQSGTGGASSGGTGGFSGGVDAGSDAGIGHGGATGAGGASAGCNVVVTRISPSLSIVVEDGPNATVQVQATATGSFSSSGVGGGGGSAVPWQWTVTYRMSADSPPTMISPSATDNTNATLEFPVVSAGIYLVQAQLTNVPSCTPGSLSVVVKDPGPMQYLLRATAAGYPVQDTSFTLGDPLQKDLLLEKGTIISVSTQSAAPNAGPLVSYVRVTDQGSGVSVDGDTSRGALSVPIILMNSYEVLLFPPDPYAPKKVTWAGGNLQSMVILDQGIPIGATTVDSGGHPVVGARMVLRSGSLTSTLRESDIGGTATLWARAGTMAMDIVPPVGSGLPSAAVGEGNNPATDPGILIGSDTASLTVSMKWDPVTKAPLTIHVLAPGGAATGAGARVRATAQATPGLVGTLIVQSAGGLPATLRATGTTDVEVVTDATGTASFTALPIGAYTVMVIPASSTAPIAASSLAITSTTVTLAAGGLTRSVMLSTKATLTGMLDPPGTLVTAIDHSVTASGAVVSATVATDGTYQLFVDPGRSYELLAQPPANIARGRAVLAQSISSATPTIPSATLPVGHPLGGKVLDSQGSGVLGGTLVQAFCISTSSRCLDATFPLAETVAGANGAYTLMLPDPPAN